MRGTELLSRLGALEQNYGGCYRAGGIKQRLCPTSALSSVSLHSCLDVATFRPYPSDCFPSVGLFY